MHRLRSLTAALLPLIAVSAPAAAQGGVDVSLTIRAEGGGAPVAGAQVEVMGTRRGATAGADGVAHIRVPPGPALFEVRKLGYRTERFSVQLPATDTLGIDVDLTVAPVQLRGVEATATATEVALRDAGFYDRQKMGIGVFLTGNRIARNPASPLIDAFRGVPGVRVVRYLAPMTRRSGPRSTTDIDTEYRVAASRAAGRECWMDLYVDDVNVGPEVLKNLPAREVVAVEVYRGPSEMPAKYRKTDNRCGAVVIWTRQGRAS
ncbi:MAG TPA: carboxypeptidase-like regulatory domain-containing protein [Longimicrobium sp.]|nr:carboxypeptidase-like regulatory domain-containing protein [Longimicrobium sp.]